MVMNSLSFLALIAASATATLALLLVFVVLVDPYGLYGSAIAPSLTKNKYKMSAFERITKPVTVCRRKPKAVILGSSRAAVGLRPASLSKRTGPAYNFGINGAYLMEINQALRASVECGVKTALYGLDFFTFTKVTRARAKQVQDVRGGFSWRRSAAFSRHTISLQAVTDSLYTLWGNIRGLEPSHNRAGMYVHYDPANVPFLSPSAEQRKPFENAYKMFNDMLAFAKRNDIDLRIFTSPVYGSHQRKDPVYTAWFVRVTTLAANYGFRIYDMAANADYTADRGNFYDVSHYRTDIGDRIIGVIFKPELRTYPDRVRHAK